MRKSFTMPDKRRVITITIEDIHIVFSFDNELSDGFYDFYREDWNKMKEHMLQKSWFTNEMFDFINSNV